MAFSDYFNYLSVFSTATVLFALLVLIPLGLFLCKYNIKFVVISVLGLILTTVYLSQFMILAVNYLKNNSHNTAGLILSYVFPVCFFLPAMFGIIRFGLQRRVNRTQKHESSPLPFALPEKTGFKERQRKALHWFTTREGIVICAIEAAVLAVHLVFISQPAESAILDEGYYIRDALNLLHGLPLNLPQHPPLGKWLIASGIFIFGDNPVGWRIFSVIFSAAGIFIFYLLCKKLTAKWPRGGTFVPLLATFLLATENLTFLMGHVMMLDVFYVTFMLLGFLLYLRGNYLACGIVMGLSLLCKITAVLPVAVIILHWTITRRREIAGEMRNTWNALQGRGITAPLTSNALEMFKMLAAAAAVWFILIIPLEYASMHHNLSNTLWYNPLFRAIYMVWHPLTETHAGIAGGTVTGGTIQVLTTPWQWLFSTNMFNVDFASGANAPRYLGVIGWAIWPLIIPSGIYLLYQSVKNRFQRQDIAFFLLCWLLGVFGLLAVMQLLTDRLTYEYYFYPAVPAVCLAVACGIRQLWESARRRPQTRGIFTAVLALYLLAAVVTFIIMSPLGTNLLK
jgi:predicted membrane-bound dolichyl-phosphate-mannose-protein mannosyltransferase